MSIQPGTALPWEARRYIGRADSWFITPGDGQSSICGRGSAALREANARYIVHAANCFPELVEALERLCAGDMDVSGTALILSNDSAEARQILQDARAALAKANEGEAR